MEDEEEAISAWTIELAKAIDGIGERDLVCLEHSGSYNAHLLRLVYEKAQAIDSLCFSLIETEW